MKTLIVHTWLRREPFVVVVPVDWSIRRAAEVAAMVANLTIPGSVWGFQGQDEVPYPRDMSVETIGDEVWLTQDAGGV